ncbi:hypothetical protein BD414DRAFT_798 [Trametes punicea]|nr:hypothetical protein BD414DRAFT_798 [Trametes punicea]
MYDPNSPIIDFYPTEFEQDLNGKKQDWEAIVKIPFIDEERLLKAMSSREHRLTEEEKMRNSFGTSTKFTYNPGEPTVYPSSLPGFFPTLYRCYCKMEPFDLPTLDGLHLVQGLCDGVQLGAEALAGFPSLQTLPHTATLGYHGVNVHGSESRNKSMVVHIVNQHENRKVEDIAQEMIGQRIFIGWPFLQEGMVSAVSDSLFTYEKISVIPGKPPKIVSNPHTPQGLGLWKMKAEKVEHYYSKRCGVITGSVDVLLHVRPLKGLKRLDNGAFVKDYEGPDKEVEQALQLAVSEVYSEDPRFMEREPPPLSEEFPEGSKVFFLGEHAYGVAAQVSATSEDTLSVILVFFPSEKTENEKFKDVVANRLRNKYFPSFKVSEMLGISGKALSKITSSFMVVGSDGNKNNLGLSLKFEAKGLKVIEYSRKDGRYWEFSEKAVELIREYQIKYPEIFQVLDKSGDAMVKASDVFRDAPNPDAKAKEVKTWLNTKGVRDFEPVSLFCDQLGKATVKEIEELADSITANKSTAAIKKAIVKGIPRQAVLKPAHAVYRLQNQHFALGDRVIMVQDSGSVPLSFKGVVVGMNAKSMDVVWDAPFMSGGTLGDRCSQYRGSTVEFWSCLNLTNPQFVVSTNPKAPIQQQQPKVPFKPRFGPHPSVRPAAGQQPAAGFRPAPVAHRTNGINGASHNGIGHNGPVQIMVNPNRGRSSAPRGGPPAATAPHVHPLNGAVNGHAKTPSQSIPHTNGNFVDHPPRGRGRGRGFESRGGFHGPPQRGTLVPPARDRGFVAGMDRGRGLPPRGLARGRGRAHVHAAPTA